MKIDLPDVNVWVALSTTDHTLHAAAARYWGTQASPYLGFCRVTGLGLLRVTTNPKLFGREPLSPRDAWASYMSWRSLEGIELYSEPFGCDEILSEWLQGNFVSHKTWTDAYLAAFAVASDFRFVTFDRGFDRFPNMDLLLLES